MRGSATAGLAPGAGRVAHDGNLRTLRVLLRRQAVAVENACRGTAMWRVSAVQRTAELYDACVAFFYRRRRWAADMSLTARQLSGARGQRHERRRTFSGIVALLKERARPATVGQASRSVGFIFTAIVPAATGRSWCLT